PGHLLEPAVAAGGTANIKTAAVEAPPHTDPSGEARLRNRIPATQESRVLYSFVRDASLRRGSNESPPAHREVVVWPSRGEGHGDGPGECLGSTRTTSR